MRSSSPDSAPALRHTKRRLGVVSLLALAALAALAGTSVAQAQTLHVSAAASMTDALNEAIETYTAEHEGLSIVPVYASSSTLARQIANDAPADLFISANLRWVDWLEEEGIPLQERTNLLQNRLALIAPADSELDDFTPGETGTLAELLGDGERLSVGDPDHVPAGLYTQQALESLGEWEALEPRLARGSDVRAALALVERGETPLGVVYQTDADASAGVRTLGQFPSDSHDPVVYPIALVGEEASDEAAAFRLWLEDDAAMEIFSRYGFAPADTDDQ